MIVLPIIAALLPVLVLLIYVNRKDLQKEPKLALFKAFMFGVCSVFVSLTFTSFITDDEDGIKTVFDAFFNAFTTAAIPEEVAKFLMLWLVLRKNKYFDEHFDGIVYSVCVGMGFAGFENIMYVFEGLDSGDWLSTSLLRAFVSIPGHFVFAVFMGYYYSLYHFGIKRNFVTACKILLVPILAHGLFDGLIFSVGVGDYLCLLVIPLFIYFLYKIYRMSGKRIKELQLQDSQEAPVTPESPEMPEAPESGDAEK